MANRGSDRNYEAPVRHPAFEADAVCAQCGTVSTEGTLLCKTCGNNLREQREQRLAAALQSGKSTTGRERSGWLMKALVLLLILIVAYVAINIRSIENILVDMQTSGTTTAHVFWSGAASAGYDEMLTELKDRPITEEEAQRAIAWKDAGETYGGRYVLMQDLPGIGRREAGQAVVYQVGDKLMFTARLSQGVEVRGDAWLEAAGQAVARDSAAVRIGNGYYTAYGFAARRQEGGLECFGACDFSDANYRVMAYRIPAPGEQPAPATEPEPVDEPEPGDEPEPVEQ